ncbi:CSC1-like protein RXW8 isoform X2 [Diospyros lotus]|nr:CSC1-like protein RXW8 isoform X2 [Diospyros lotus]
MQHHHIRSESLDVFTIGNVKERSKWIWAHCLALYIISCSACLLLYVEHKNITKKRLVHITGLSRNPSHFTVVVRGIPWSPKESYSVSVRNFFGKYYASSYLSHQMVYRSGIVQKLMSDAAKMYEMIRFNSTEPHVRSNLLRCCVCGGTTHSFRMLSNEPESICPGSDNIDPDLREKECAAALIFYRTRYAALVASRVLQSSNPMHWVTDRAPEPLDVYWKNLCIPYKQLWIRKLATRLASLVLTLLFIVPVGFVQGLLHLEGLQKRFPFLKGDLENKYIIRVVTGYLPSVVLMIFLYAVPPAMMWISTIEGSISRSARKRSACTKVLYFLIWNIFFGNVLSGKLIERLSVFSRPGDVTALLATAVPAQTTFFMTYVLTSGWASLSTELMQPYVLICNFFYKFILRNNDGPSCGILSFPYHTELPRVLLFGFVGFVYSVMAPLILPFLLVYFFLANLVYRNQILNVYVTKYQSGGRFWPIVHNSTIFSLVLTQVLSMAIFGLKKSTVASGFTIPLIICTLLYNEFCKQRFIPVFKNNVAQVFIDMDQKDADCGMMEEIHEQLRSAYCQFASTSNDLGKNVPLNHFEDGHSVTHKDPEDMKNVPLNHFEDGHSVTHKDPEDMKSSMTSPGN